MKKGQTLLCKKDHTSKNGFLVKKDIEYVVVDSQKPAQMITSNWDPNVGVVLIQIVEVEDIKNYFLNTNKLPYEMYELSILTENHHQVFPYVWDYFYTEKEYRKLKLEQINGI